MGETATAYEPFDVHRLARTVQIPPESVTVPTVTPAMTNFFTTAPTGKNLVNVAASTIGQQLKADGTTEPSHAGNYDTTPLIDVTCAAAITISRESGPYTFVRCVLFYDKQGKPMPEMLAVSVVGAVMAHTLLVPTTAGFVRISYPALCVNLQIGQGTAAASYEPFAGGTRIQRFYLPGKDGGAGPAQSGPWYGKKAVFNCDSITAGFAAERPAFPVMSRASFGMAVANYAIGGSTIAGEGVRHDRPRPHRHPPHHDGRRRRPRRHRRRHQRPDVCLDPFGTMADRTVHTFYGSLHTLCLSLIERYPDRQVVLVTLIKRRETANTLGLTTAAYADAILEVGGHYGIPVLDAYREIMLNKAWPSQAFVADPPNPTALFAYTGGHPNRAGQRVMARRVTGFPRQLV